MYLLNMSGERKSFKMMNIVKWSNQSPIKRATAFGLGSLIAMGVVNLGLGIIGALTPSSFGVAVIVALLIAIVAYFYDVDESYEHQEEEQNIWTPKTPFPLDSTKDELV